MQCIFCETENDSNTIEHIVPESFGNKDYVMQKGKVCDDCNNLFSKFESTALANSVYVVERARLGIASKKGKSAKGRVKELTIEGDENLRETYLKVSGLNEENFKNFNPITRAGHLIVSGFDKAEVSTSRLLLKIGFESIYTSRRKIFKKYDFTELKDYITNKNNYEWPFITADITKMKLTSIPMFFDKYLLKRRYCELNFIEIDKDTLLFNYIFCSISATINLINRETDWTDEPLAKDKNATIYPIKFRKNIMSDNEERLAK
jgi:hypothetical protein